jgi:hypothetical protein
MKRGTVLIALFFALFALGDSATVSWDTTSDGIWNGPFWDLPVVRLNVSQSECNRGSDVSVSFSDSHLVPSLLLPNILG